MNPITKQDLKEALKDIAKAGDLNDLAGDVVRIEKKFDNKFEGLEKHVKNIPTRDEFPALLEKTFQFVVLKAEHDRIKKIIRDKLGVEV